MSYACIDIGGTAIKFAVFDQNQKLIEKEETDTPCTLDELCCFLYQKLDNLSNLKGISFSVPGAVNEATGIIEGYSAVLYLQHQSLQSLMAKYHVPVYVENDANCVALSELIANPTLQNSACVVIGTGIGGAMIINRQLFRGKHGLAGEFGYLLLTEPTEQLNNWSTLASTGSLVRYVTQKSQEQHLIDSTYPTQWNGKKIYEFAERGDALCQQAIQRMYNYLAKGIVTIQYLCDPDVIYLGGSISQNSEFIQGVERACQHLVNTYDEYTIAPIIKACTYQHEANLYGALANLLIKER